MVQSPARYMSLEECDLNAILHLVHLISGGVKPILGSRYLGLDEVLVTWLLYPGGRLHNDYNCLDVEKSLTS